MPRSAGVTTSAVIVFIGSAFSILCGATMVLMSVFSMYSSRAEETAGFNVHYILAVESVFFFGFGGWGVATGIGLIKTKQWARISLLIYSAILVFFSLPAAVIMVFIPLPNGAAAGDANLPANFTTIIRVVITLVYGGFAALGGFWLYFFNTRRVKAQFLLQQAAAEPAVGGLALGTPIALPGESHPRRPLSITIIGWYLLIACAFAPLFILYSRSVYRGVNIPFGFLGFFLYGRSATLLLCVTMGAQIISAIGLLKLKRWALNATIGLQCLVALNTALMVAVPANRLRLQQFTEALRNSRPPSMYHSGAFSFPAWITLVVSFPLLIVILWYLVAERHAFNSSAQDPGNLGR